MLFLIITQRQEWEQYKGQLGVSEELSDAQLAARLQVDEFHMI